MRDLRLVGVTDDGTRLVLDGSGEHFVLPIDAALRAALRQDSGHHVIPGHHDDRPMSPVEVQALIRSGADAEEAARRAGWTVEKVRRYEGPILAERAHVARIATTTRLRPRGPASGSPTLIDRVTRRLHERGISIDDADWDSWRSEDGQWVVEVYFTDGGERRRGSWSFDKTALSLRALDHEAALLSDDDPDLLDALAPAATSAPAPDPAYTALPARPSRVHVDEASDLMASLRSTSGARSRGRSRRPEPHPAPEPGQALPTVEATPMPAAPTRAEVEAAPATAPTPVPTPEPVAGEDEVIVDAVVVEDTEIDAPDAPEPNEAASSPHPGDRIPNPFGDTAIQDSPAGAVTPRTPTETPAPTSPDAGTLTAGGVHAPESPSAGDHPETVATDGSRTPGGPSEEAPTGPAFSPAPAVPTPGDLHPTRPTEPGHPAEATPAATGDGPVEADVESPEAPVEHHDEGTTVAEHVGASEEVPSSPAPATEDAPQVAPAPAPAEIPEDRAHVETGTPTDAPGSERAVAAQEPAADAAGDTGRQAPLDEADASPSPDPIATPSHPEAGHADLAPSSEEVMPTQTPQGAATATPQDAATHTSQGASTRGSDATGGEAADLTDTGKTDPTDTEAGTVVLDHSRAAKADSTDAATIDATGTTGAPAASEAAADPASDPSSASGGGASRERGAASRRRRRTGGKGAGSASSPAPRQGATAAPATGPTPGTGPADPTPSPSAAGEGQESPTDAAADQPAKKTPRGNNRRKGRASVPAWDDIMFGSKPGAED